MAGFNDSSIQLEGGEGGGGSSSQSLFSVSVDQKPTSIDASKSNWNQSSKSAFVGDGLSSITLKYNGSEYRFAYIRKAEIYVGGVLWRTLTFGGGDTLWRTCNYAILTSEDVSANWAKRQISMGLYDRTTYVSGNPYEYSDVSLNQEPSFTTSGTKTISVKVYYYLSARSYDHASTLDSSLFTSETLVAGRVTVLAPTVSSISLSGGKRKFYAGETFDYSSLVVTATYKYQVDGGVAYSSEVSGYSVNSSSVQTVIDMALSTSYSATPQTATVTVTYSGKNASYSITAYGIASYTKPDILSPRGDSNFRVGETTYSIDNSTITYADGTTESAEVSVVSGFRPSTSWIDGTSATLSITASKTGQTKTWSSTYYVYPPFKLALNTASVQKNFDADDEFNYANLVVTAYYGKAGNESAAGTAVVTPDFVMFPDNSVGANKTVTVAYGGISETYKINVNGLYDLQVDISSYGANLRVPKNGALSYANAVFRVKRYVSGVLSNWTTSNLPTITAGELDTSTAGNKTVTFSATEDGATVTKDVPVVVYTISSISVSNMPTKIIYEDDDYPVLDLTSFAVGAITSDGQSVTLTYNAVNNGYEVLIDGVLCDDDEVTLTDSVSIVVRSKTEPSVAYSNTITVAQKQAEADAPLVVSGSLVYVQAGEKINLSGFVVQQKMNDGTYEVIDDYTCVISGKDGLQFDDEDDTNEYYDLVFSKSPSADTTVSDTVFLDGVSAVTIDPLPRNVFDIGEDTTAVLQTLTCTVDYYHAQSQTNMSFRFGTDYDLLNREFVLADANGNDGAVVINMTLYGKSKSVTVYIRKVSSLTKVAVGTANYDYDIHDALNPAGNNYKFQKVYNKKIDNVDTYDVSDSDLSFSFSGGDQSCSASDLVPTRSTDVVSVTASYTENGETVSASAFNISVLRLKSVDLIDDDANVVSAIYLDKGSHLDLSEYRLYVQYNDSTSSTEYVSAASALSPSDGTIINSAVSSATASYSYHGDSVSTTYDIHIHYVSAITTNLTSVVDEEYYVGDTLDLTSVTASRTYSSSDEEEDGYPYTESFTPSFVLDSMNIADEYPLVSAGSYTVSFTDNGITKSASFAVYAVVLSSIATSTSAAFKPFTDYVEGQRLNLTGLSIVKTYNSGATNTIAYTDPMVEVVDGDGDAFSKTKELALSDDDVELFAKITENGVTKTASIGTLSVAANELDSIEIMSSSANKTTFTYGDRFSIDGLIVKANFTNGSSSGVALASLSVSGETLGHVFNPTDDQTFGTIAITVSYTHGGITKTASFNITLAKPVLSSISTNATSDAVVTQFVDGDAYSESGLVVVGTFANGWTYTLQSTDWSTNATSVLTISDGNIDMTGNYGAKTITVSANNPFDSNQTAVTTTYSVDIMTSGAIVSAVLMFDSDVDFENYTVGDVFNARGAYFHVTDIDGIESDVRTFVTNPAKGSVLRSAQRIEVSCTYTKTSFTTTATYKILVSVPNVVSLTETNDYKLAIGKSDGTLIETITHEEQTIAFGKTYDSDNNVTGEYYPLFHESKIAVDNNQAHSSTYGLNVYTGVDMAGDCIGYIDLGVTASDGTVVRQAHVVLFDDPLNPIDGQGNVEVLFPHYVAGLSDRINKCRFGIVYNNRLFLSGNPDFKSCDWHSGAVNVSQAENYDRNTDLDFTYFSDLDYCFYGTDDTAIVGYDIYRDGDLIAVKEGSRFQATLYRRSYKLIAATSYDGTSVQADTTLAEEAFPMFDINANGGVGGLSNRSILNFVGETIVVTKDGVKAITSKDNVYNSAKYSFDVSSYINPRISKENLKNAFAFAYGEKLLLKTERGVYVGYNELRNEAGEYEWYFLADLPADMFFEHDDELYFANDDGEVFRFPKNILSYRDKDRDFIGQGGAYLTIDEANNRIIAGNAYADQIEAGRAFHLITTYSLDDPDSRTLVHSSIGTFVNSNYRANMIETGGSYDDTAYNGEFDPSTNIITIKKRNSDGSADSSGTLAIQDLYYDGRKVRFDSMLPSESGDLNLYEDYVLSKVGDNQYKIVDGSGNVVSLSDTNSMRMVFIVNDLSVTFIQDVQPYGESGAKSFSLLGDHSQTLDLVYYNNQLGYYSGVVTTENKVQSFYVTAPYSMGTISSVKTIWAWVITNDTNLASYMDVGYISSRRQGGFETIVKSSPASRDLNFANFEFSKVSFLNDSLPHVYTKYRTLASVNFIRFAFKNEEDSNIALTAMDVIYTVSGLAKGAH